MNDRGSLRRYVLGDTEEELIRLAQQAAMFSEFTAEILREAGITTGMRVLDLGCGVGDVTMLAAGLVGPSGAVVGLDASAHALDTARLRTAAAGINWASFEQADIFAMQPGDAFDAVIGRFILMHLPDPAAAIRSAMARIRPGGSVAFVELDVDSALAMPSFDLFDQCMDWIKELYSQLGIERNMGSKLYASFCHAGLAPGLSSSVLIEGGKESTAHDYVAEAIRSLQPSLEASGVATAAEIDITTLADRLFLAAKAQPRCFVYPRLTGAWATRPE